ncbi:MULTISPECIES: hypothetical protein [Halobacterium]|uniref:hypothetical protein n=1 Tax=Halobacterium TaxID=2239 RepID=UPI0019633902|nr:hypothetical protein [Halobacterium sp. GSL-19]QRY22085.1 hypothetical protein JT689_08635 [Halobacterium sp. GSL-19]
MAPTGISVVTADGSSPLVGTTLTVHLFAATTGVLAAAIVHHYRARIRSAPRALLGACLLAGALYGGLWVGRQLLGSTTADWAAEITGIRDAALVAGAVAVFCLVVAATVAPPLWLLSRDLLASALLGLFATTYNLVWALLTTSTESNSLIIHLGVAYPVLLAAMLVAAGVEVTAGHVMAVLQ